MTQIRQKESAKDLKNDSMPQSEIKKRRKLLPLKQHTDLVDVSNPTSYQDPLKRKSEDIAITNNSFIKKEPQI